MADTTTNRGYEKPVVSHRIVDDLPILRATIDAIDVDMQAAIDAAATAASGSASAQETTAGLSARITQVEASAGTALSLKADGPATDTRFHDLEAAVAGLQASVMAGATLEKTWSALNARVPGSAGLIAYIPETETGTHTDPVTGATVPDAGEYRSSISPPGWERIGARSTPSAATRAEMLAAALNTKMATPLNTNQLLTALYSIFRASGVKREGSALVLHDRKGTVLFEIRLDGRVFSGGKQLAFAPTDMSGFDPRQRMGLIQYGGSHATDQDAGAKPIGITNNALLIDEDGDGEPDSDDEVNYRTYMPAFMFQMNTGLESYSGSSYGTVAATGTTGFNPGGTRERTIVPLTRALSYGLLSKSELVIDIAGVTGSGGQLDLLGKGTAAFANMVNNQIVAYNEALADGKTYGIFGALWLGGDQDWRDPYTEETYLSAFRQFDKDEREALNVIGSNYARFVVQFDGHCFYSSPTQLHVVSATGRFSEIPNNFVVGPAYPYSHVLGNSPTREWSDAVLLDEHGKRNLGNMISKAALTWALTGSWRPCEMVSAKRTGPRQIDVGIYVPVPPLQVSTSTVAELADGCHGLEVWAGSTRISLLNATIAYDGRVGSIAKVTINTATDLQLTGVEVWSARSSDIVGTVNGNIIEGRQPGPLTGPRTTLCDSDNVDGEIWFNRMNKTDGKPYDMRNYLTIKRMPVS